MKKFFTLLFLGFGAVAFGQDTIAKWTFDQVTFATAASTTPSFTAGTSAADVGMQTAGSAFTGLHASASTQWSTPAGNGTPKSASANNWGVGDYFEFQFSTLNYASITLEFETYGSNTGPADFKVQYSTNGSTFNDFASNTYTVINSPGSWSASGGPKAGYVTTMNLSSISDVNNKASVYVRLINTTTASVNGATTATGGTSRIDNFTVLGASTLPITLASFNANATLSSVVLSWNTSSEINAGHFEVEKSVNGKDYVAIGKVKASGNENGSAYEFTDELSKAVVYYRLKMVDKDGSFIYSKEVVVRSERSASVSVYPNPVRDVMVISHGKSQNAANIEVFNTMGVRVLAAKSVAQTETTSVNLSNLPSGNYILVVADGNNKSTLNFVKY